MDTFLYTLHANPENINKLKDSRIIQARGDLPLVYRELHAALAYDYGNSYITLILPKHVEWYCEDTLREISCYIFDIDLPSNYERYLIDINSYIRIEHSKYGTSGQLYLQTARDSTWISIFRNIDSKKLQDLIPFLYHFKTVLQSSFPSGRSIYNSIAYRGIEQTYDYSLQDNDLYNMFLLNFIDYYIRKKKDPQILFKFLFEVKHSINEMNWFVSSRLVKHFDKYTGNQFMKQMEQYNVSSKDNQVHS